MHSRTQQHLIVQGKGEKSDMSPFDAMASVLEDIELLKKKQPFHEQMVLFGWAC
jgi:hypothetical protein